MTELLFSFLRNLLRSPSAYRTDPWAYARNQIGHGYLLGGLTVLMLGPQALWPCMALYALWEVVQWQRYAAEASDCVEDAAHVLTVALAAALHEPAILMIHAVYLAAGLLWRIENRRGR